MLEFWRRRRDDSLIDFMKLPDGGKEGIAEDMFVLSKYVHNWIVNIACVDVGLPEIAEVRRMSTVQICSTMRWRLAFRLSIGTDNASVRNGGRLYFTICLDAYPLHRQPVCSEFN